MSPKIVFRNEHFVVCFKPPLWLSVPPRFSDDPRPILGRWLETELKQTVYPTHRLDFEVSGLILFALSAGAHREANLWFEEKSILKTYFAITEKSEVPPEGQQEWKSYLVKGKKRTFSAPYGKLALTRARIQGSGQDWLLWELSPITGRSHQLRFELSNRGFPIFNDVLYGSKKRLSEILTQEVTSQNDLVPFFLQSEGISLVSARIEFPKTSLEQWGLPGHLNLLN